MFFVTEPPSVMKKEEEKVEQEIESDGEKKTQGTLRMSMDGMTMKDKCERLEPCGVMIRQRNYRQRASVLNSAFCACLRASRHSRYCPQWSHRC